MKYKNELEKYLDMAIQKLNKGESAYIQKTPEPFQVIRKQLGNCNVYEGYKEKRSQPPYVGVIKGGRTIVFGVVSVGGKAARISCLTKAQMDALVNYKSLGAQVCIFVSFGGGKKFYRIPVDMWVNMERYFDRNFILAKDIAEFEVKFRNGFYDFFDGLLEG